MNVKPPKLLSVMVTNTNPVEFWEDATGQDFWNYVPYRWEVTLTVTPQGHSAPDTSQPFWYDGMDVTVGDWIANGIGGLAVKIYEIISQDSNNVIALVEDVERFNTYTDPYQSGNGCVVLGDGFIFEMGQEGLPIVTPMTNFSISAQTITDLMNRFQYRNLIKAFVGVNQPGHDMELGDVIRPDFENPGQYVKAIADNKVNYAVGLVSSVGVPGPDYFTFKPFGRMIEKVEPALSGAYGDMFYIDPTMPGKLTNDRPAANARPVYLKLDGSRAILLEMAGEDIVSETEKFDVKDVELNQTVFQLPMNVRELMYMAINGIENENYTFDPVTKIVVFDPVATGYGVEPSDEVFFVYKT